MLDQTVEVLPAERHAIDPRSPQHVRMMQTLSLQERSIDELAYVADGYVRCTSWGIPDDQARLEPPHLHLKNGAALRLDAVPVVSPGLRMVAVRYGDYSALIEPGQFTQLTPTDGVQMALVLPGSGMLGSHNHPDLMLVAQALNGGKLDVEEDYLTAVARGDDITVVLLEPASEALSSCGANAISGCRWAA